MTVKERIDEALTLVVPVSSTKDHNHSDLIKLMDSYKVIELAKDDFLNQKISFEEYIELCKLHGMNIDNYMEIVSHNLVELNLI